MWHTLIPAWNNKEIQKNCKWHTLMGSPGTPMIFIEWIILWIEYRKKIQFSIILWIEYFWKISQFEALKGWICYKCHGIWTFRQRSNWHLGTPDTLAEKKREHLHDASVQLHIRMWKGKNLATCFFSPYSLPLQAAVGSSRRRRSFPTVKRRRLLPTSHLLLHYLSSPSLTLQHLPSRKDHWCPSPSPPSS